MFKAKFISKAVLPCEVAPAITEIAPAGIISSSPFIVYPDPTPSGLRACLCFTSFSSIGFKRLLNTVDLSFSFISGNLLSSSSRALSPSPFACKSEAVDRSLFSSLSFCSVSSLYWSLSTTFFKLSSVIPKVLIASIDRKRFINLSLSRGSFIFNPVDTISSNNKFSSLSVIIPVSSCILAYFSIIWFR